MVQKIGRKLPNMCLRGKENNVDRDGSTTWILVLIKENGPMMKNGFYICYILATGTDGRRFQSICLEEQIII